MLVLECDGFGVATLLTPAQSPAWGVPCISPQGGN
jgi:hypothetical protein